MRSTEVAMIIDEIRNKVESKKTISDDDYSDFKKEYPKIYSMCLSKNFNRPQMNFFLSNLQKIENKETSEHAASVKIGTMLVDKYVKPHVKN